MRYERYRKTGIPWLPEVPEEWEVVLNQFLFRENVRTPLPDDIPLSLSQVDGLIPTDMMKEKSLKTSSYEGWKRVLRNDLVLNRFKAHLGVLFASEYIGMVSFHYGVYESIARLIPKYYEYLYHTPVYRFIYSIASKGMTVGLQNLSNTAFYNTKSPLPPLPTQRAIVAFLDEKCGKVDRLVAAKEKEAALLKELKQSMIVEVVTGKVECGVRSAECGGRNGKTNRPTKPSGIPWLPEVPEGWEVVKVKQVADENKAKNKDGNEGNILSLSYGNIIRKANPNAGLTPSDYSGYSIVKKGMIVLRLTDLQNDHRSLRTGLVKERGIITSAYVSLIPKGILPEYLQLALHTWDLLKIFYSMGDGLRQTMNFGDVSKLPIPLPPLPEQKVIVAYIETRAAKIDAAVAGLEREIAALKEYRERLIADVVTGERRVWNAECGVRR